MRHLQIGLLFFAFISTGLGQYAQRPSEIDVRIDSLNLFDTLRNRAIPVALYAPVLAHSQRKEEKQKVAVISHGYGGKNTEYSFIAHNLAAQGYVVVSIQHELPTDEPLPTAGNPYETRMPNWKRGAATIGYVIRVLQTRKPNLNFGRLLLLGHSNGGDMSALFARDYPDRVFKLITLDNRRMPLPRTRQPQILSIRSSDQPADAGVLPTLAERKQFKIEIIRLDNLLHNDMWDGATDAQKREINVIISDFVKK